MSTIAAIATAPGVGAIAVIRISGPLSFEIAEAIFSRPTAGFKSHTAHYGHILSAFKETIDSVLLMRMKGPNTYTGEDSVEISCHGGPIVTERVLKRIFEAGAIPAAPGEFSLRAYLNGKLDLAQAEAVQTLIAAKSEQALSNAEKQLDGALSEKIKQFQKKLTDIAAILEAAVDFPEEDLEFASLHDVILALQEILASMEHLKNTFHNGKKLNTDVSLCLLGAPNVGKSSLMNALLGKERAIVTPIAGTTRDFLEEELKLGAYTFRLIDTAGIRDTSETIEQEGIRRSQKAMQEADIVLLLLDATRPRESELLQHVKPEKTIVLWNKCDLAMPPEGGIAISALHKTGLDALTAAIEQRLGLGDIAKDEVLITASRHFEALHTATAHLNALIHGLKSGVSPEFASSDMRATLTALGTIIGTNVTEDILSAIFSKFCLGK